jgi:hypothetical protein
LIATTIVFSCLGLLTLIGSMMALFAPDYAGDRKCMLCIAIWTGTIGVACFFVAANPGWVAR